MDEIHFRTERQVQPATVNWNHMVKLNKGISTNGGQAESVHLSNEAIIHHGGKMAACIV